MWRWILHLDKGWRSSNVGGCGDGFCTWTRDGGLQMWVDVEMDSAIGQGMEVFKFGWMWRWILQLDKGWRSSNFGGCGDGFCNTYERLCAREFETAFIKPLPR